MAEIEWAILCDYAFLDVGRKTCLIGTFDRIYTQNVPAHHHQAAIVAKFTGNPGEQLRFKIEAQRPPSSGGGTLATINGEIRLSDTGTAEFVANMAGLPLPDYGPYAFNFYIGEELAKTITFTVLRPPAQTPPSPSG